MSGTLARLQLENFTAFRSLDVSLSPSVNVFIGANGTGKTDLLKVLYTACDASRKDKPFGDKLSAVFLPYDGRIGRLANRQSVSVIFDLAAR